MTSTATNDPAARHEGWNTLRRFIPYLWPKDRLDLRLRIVGAVLLILAAKGTTLLLPFAYKHTIDAMGTKVGDATELSSLAEVFRSADGKDAWCALGSVKSQIGHTKAAAGVAGAMAPELYDVQIEVEEDILHELDDLEAEVGGCAPVCG